MMKGTHRAAKVFADRELRYVAVGEGGGAKQVRLL